MAKVEGTGIYFDFRKAVLQPVFNKEHLWVMSVVYKVNAEEVVKGGQVIMDRESFINAAGPGCYFCYQAYTPEVAVQECRGEDLSDAF